MVVVGAREIGAIAPEGCQADFMRSLECTRKSGINAEVAILPFFAARLHIGYYGRLTHEADDVEAYQPRMARVSRVSDQLVADGSGSGQKSLGDSGPIDVGPQCPR